MPFTMVEMDWSKHEHKSPAWTKNQPFGQVPYLDDDGFILFESRAIGKYIATKYASSGTPLLPSSNDAQTMALVEQGVSIENNNFNPGAEGLALERIFKQSWGAEAEPKFVEKWETTLAGRMDGFEAILSKQKYIGGNELTYADFFFLPYGEILIKLGYDYLTNEEKYPHVARWWKELSSRESWQKAKGGIKGIDA